MSITPTGGWSDPPLQEPEAPRVARRPHLTCKICDSGTLNAKSVFRLSTPVAVIGFILLIPSILGIIFSALLFFGVNVITSTKAHDATSKIGRPSQNDFDSRFRKSCAKSLLQENQSAGIYTSHQEVEQVCECSLADYKETGSATLASETCSNRFAQGTLAQPSQNVDSLYPSDPLPSSSEDNESSGIARFVGSSFAIALGVASFVGGLLGWLLVMRKRILQCDVCGAVVTAS